MKKILNLSRVLFPALMLLQLNLFAQDSKNDNKKYDFVKTKSINKLYTVSSNNKLIIDNSFGKVEVRVWDKNEIKVDVTIEVSSNKESNAQKLIDQITVAEEQRGKEIYFKTSIKGNNNSKGEKTSMQVNYSISMPSSNALKIANDFGEIVIPDFKGEIELLSKFGSLTAGILSNVNKVQVEFGKAIIASITNGSVYIKYSKAEISKLVGNVKLNLEFSTATKIKVDNSLTGLYLNASYSSLNLQPANDLQASYSIRTSFGSLKNNTSIKFNNENEDNDNKGTNFDNEYKGKSGNGSVVVNMKTSFGNIVLGEPGPDDMKGKSKSKGNTQ